MSAKLGEILVRENLLSPQQLREALDYQREHGGRLGFNLVKLGFISDDMITAVLSRQYGVPSVNLDLFDIDDSVIRLIPHEVAQKYSVLPLSRVGATLTLAMVDPTNVYSATMNGLTGVTTSNVTLTNITAAARSNPQTATQLDQFRVTVTVLTPGAGVGSSRGRRPRGLGNLRDSALSSCGALAMETRCACAVLDALSPKVRRGAQRAIDKARAKGHQRVLDKITEEIEGEHRIVEERPLIVRETHIDTGTPIDQALDGMLRSYIESLTFDRRRLLARYRIVAPTEWNFHPRGAFSRGLAGIPARNEEEVRRAAALLAHALDPCVAYDLRVKHA